MTENRPPVLCIASSKSRVGKNKRNFYWVSVNGASLSPTSEPFSIERSAPQVYDDQPPPRLFASSLAVIVRRTGTFFPSLAECVSISFSQAKLSML